MIDLTAHCDLYNQRCKPLTQIGLGSYTPALAWETGHHRLPSEREYEGLTDDAIGGRDQRDWWPPDLIQTPASLIWPPRPVAALKWLFGFPGYLWPMNSFYLAMALVTWFFLTPDLASMRSFEPGWMAIIFGRNPGVDVPRLRRLAPVSVRS